ncbi:MAG: SDR family NAD(P)-dependent oxidoreductase [Actinomycetota bacterium]
MGRVALVTGSSRGLGAEIARRLAADGFAVAVNGIEVDETERVAASIRDAGLTASAFVADVTDPVGVERLVTEVERALGPIHALVLNATGPQPVMAMEQVGWPEHVAELDFFVKSPVLFGEWAVPRMRAGGGGRIVNIDSDVADRPPPGRSAYATAKSAQAGLTRAWAAELAADGITVNSVAPAFVPVERHDDVPAEERDRYLRDVPVGRMGRPEDVAHVVSFLVSEGAGFVTGQRIVVDGGRSLKN